MLINEDLMFKFVDKEPCRKCGTPIRKVVPKRKGYRPNQEFYYAYIYRCFGCKTTYMPEDGKRDFVKGQRIPEN